MSLTQLEYIVAVAKHRNFSLAAKFCSVSQPTLSVQIQKLEDELGVVIFDRTVQPVCATPIGQKILDQSRVLLAQAALLADIVSQEKEEIAGELRLAIIPTLAPYLLPLFLERFAKAYPRLRLRIEESKTDDIVAALRENQLDMGVLVTPLGEAQIMEHKIFSEPFFVYAAKASPLARLEEISDADLQKENLLLLSEGHCMREQMLRVCRHRKARPQQGTGAQLQFDSGSIETLCRLVEKGHGYTIIPQLAQTSQESRGGKVIPFNEPRPSREVSLVVHRSFARHKLLRALLESIQASLPAELRHPRGAGRTVAPR